MKRVHLLAVLFVFVSLIAVPCLAELQAITILGHSPDVIDGSEPCYIWGGWGTFPLSEYPTPKDALANLEEGGYRIDLYADDEQVSAHVWHRVLPASHPDNWLDEPIRSFRWRHIFGRNLLSPGIHVFKAVYIVESLGFEMSRTHEVLVTYPEL